MTSDNISPHHLMDIKRVAFETKPVTSQSAVGSWQMAAKTEVSQSVRTAPNRDQIAAIVDGFLKQKLAETPELPKQVISAEVKTVVHDVTPENAVQKPVAIETVDFVSEDDVRRAVEKGEKIYISKKTILTPSARDLGEEKDIFASV